VSGIAPALINAFSSSFVSTDDVVVFDFSDAAGGGGGGGGDVADVYGDGVRDIRLSKKNPLGVKTTGVCCYR
jgi:hypothetical protein